MLVLMLLQIIKKPLLYILPFLLLSSLAWAKTENTYYSDYLGQCSQSDIKHYSLKNESLQGKEYNEVDIFESTQLDVDCLAESLSTIIWKTRVGRGAS